jgi:hypothetical protein
MVKISVTPASSKTRLTALEGTRANGRPPLWLPRCGHHRETPSSGCPSPWSASTDTGKPSRVSRSVRGSGFLCPTGPRTPDPGCKVASQRRSLRGAGVAVVGVGREISACWFANVRPAHLLTGPDGINALAGAPAWFGERHIAGFEPAIASQQLSRRALASADE